MIENLTVIGPGLIGGSLIRALKENNGVKNVTACSRNMNNLDKALKLGVIDTAIADTATAVREADIVVIATPVGAILEVFKTIKDQLKPQAVVTDVGSVKMSLIRELQAEYGDVPQFFVPAHPVAGTEKSGVEASFASLFADRKVILTPTANTDPDSLKRVRDMWEMTGAKVIEMDGEWHDIILSATSHLPHVLAYALVTQLSSMQESEDIFTLAAGGFRDFSRIASSDATMWRDICLSNTDKIREMLKSYQLQLAKMDKMLKEQDSEGLYKVFANAKKVRDAHFE